MKVVRSSKGFALAAKYWFRLAQSLSYRKNYYLARVTSVLWSLLHRAIISDCRDRVLRKELFIFSPVWGDHIETLFDYTIPSLFQDGNLPKLSGEYNLVFFIYTDDKFTEQIRRRLQREPRPCEFVITTESMCERKPDLLLTFLVDMIMTPGVCVTPVEVTTA